MARIQFQGRFFVAAIVPACPVFRICISTNIASKAKVPAAAKALV